MRPRYSFSSRKSRRAKESEKLRKQRQEYPRLLQEVINSSDIILEVLDARFPEETRNLEIEGQIKGLNKKLIYVLNKSDLMHEQKSEFKEGPKIFVSCKDRYGISELRRFIKILAKKIQKKPGEKINAGVVGYPNTGKSSLINMLIGRSAAGVGQEAGFTKGLQKLRLAEKIILLDTPGVIPEEKYSHTEKEKIAEHAIVGSRAYSSVKEPEMAIAEIMKKFPGVLEKFYGIQAGDNSEILIEELGKKKNFLKKGGLVDEDRTARFILRAWQEGKIKI